MENKIVLTEVNLNNQIYRMFNENHRDNYWGKRNQRVWYSQMVSVLDGIFANIKKRRKKEFCRLNYKNFGNYIMFDSQIWSKAAIDNKKNKINPTKDHIIGNTSIGEYAWDSIDKRELREDNVDVWLKENLWLWLIINVSQEEHKVKNILRNTLSPYEKLELKHYKNVSPLYYKNEDKLIWTQKDGFIK